MAVKKIVIITTGQPATNPRAVKEATALHAAGYDVYFIYSFWADWAVPFDKEIIDNGPGIKWILVGGDPFESRFLWIYSRARHKLSRFLSKSFRSNLMLARNAASRTGYSLIKAATRIKADLYIAHNLGALPAAALASRKYKSHYAFDAEDYHRGQEVTGSAREARMILLEQYYIPGAAFLSAASPLIAERYSFLFDKETLVINNVFSKKFKALQVQTPAFPLKLFWFSQTIGKGRGIEDVILALREMPENSYTLSLLGKYNEPVKDYFLQLAANGKSEVDITFHLPVSPEEIFKIAAMHDIGLALEQPVKLKNSDLCLANKIFTYLLAGNAVIFSDTSAHADFFKSNHGIGALYQSGNISQLKNILQSFLDLSSLLSMKQKASQLSEEIFNWEAESHKLLNKVNQILKN